MTMKLLNFSAVTVYTVLFGIFGFMNPDQKNCWYYPGLDSPRKDPTGMTQYALSMGLKYRKGYPLNMANIYHIWF